VDWWRKKVKNKFLKNPNEKAAPNRKELKQEKR